MHCSNFADREEHLVYYKSFAQYYLFKDDEMVTDNHKSYSLVANVSNVSGKCFLDIFLYMYLQTLVIFSRVVLWV